MDIKNRIKYWVIEFIDGDETKWNQVLDYVLPIATHVEFNILYSDKNLKDFQQEYHNSIVEIIRKKDKMYSSGKVLKMKVTDQVVELLKNKEYSAYKNWFLEDPSFYVNDQEIVATITHEDQIYLNPMYIDLNEFTQFKMEHKLFVEKEFGFWKALKRKLKK